MQILTVIYHGIYIVIFHVIYGSFLKLQTASGKLQEAAGGYPEASGGYPAAIQEATQKL
jgi:hypothetical protein